MGNRRDAEQMGDQELVEALNDIEDGLWDKDLSFVDDLGRRLRREGSITLSPGQRKWAEDIWERAG